MTITESTPKMPQTDDTEFDDPGTSPVGFVSYSSLTTHRRCPQAWAYKYVRHLAPSEVEITIDRDLGSWWHAIRAADSIERGRTIGSLRSAPEEITTSDGGPTFTVGPMSVPSLDAILLTFSEWFGRQSADARDAWTERCGGDPADLLEAMNRRWHRRWAAALENEAPVAVELKWKRELPGTDAVMGGYIDEVLLDTKRNLVIVRDHKSMKQIQVSAEDDLMDSQLFVYAWGATPLIKQLTDGRGPTALSYDRIRTMPPKEPSVTASGGLSKSVKDYDRETYIRWAEGPDGRGVPWGEEGKFFASGPRKGQPKFGRYEADPDVIANLSTPAAEAVWADRTRAPMNLNVVRAHLRAAVDTHRASEASLARVERSGDASRNFTSACKWCDFADLCRAEMIGGPGNDYELSEFGLIKTRRSR